MHRRSKNTYSVGCTRAESHLFRANEAITRERTSTVSTGAPWLQTPVDVMQLSAVTKYMPPFLGVGCMYTVIWQRTRRVVQRWAQGSC